MRLSRIASLSLPVIVLVFAFIAGACTIQTQIENGVSQGVNQVRTQAGLPPLTADPELAAVARHRAQDMANLDYFSHNPPDGCPARCLMQKAGLAPAWSGEIIAWNDAAIDSSVSMAVNMWSNSPPHYAVITGRCFTRMGAGVAFTPDGSKGYFVVVFEGDDVNCQQ